MITELDYSILNFIQGLHNPFLDTVMPYITYLGSGGILWIVICVFLIVRKSDRITGIKTAVSIIIGTVLFVLVVKNLVGRERPFNQAAGMLDASELLIPPPSDRYSFPSGHSLVSFAAACSVVIHKRVMGCVCIAAAALIAFSRMYLYVHFPTDVFFGMIFGILCAVVSNIIIDKVMKKIDEKKLPADTR